MAGQAVLNVAKDVIPVPLQGAANQLTILNVSGDTLSVADNEEKVSPVTLTAGQSQAFTQTVWIWSASHTAIQVAWQTTNGPATANTPFFTSIILTPSGGDNAAPMQAAINQLAGNGSITMGPGTFLWKTTPPVLPANATAVTVRGSGRASTTIQLSVGSPRAFDPPAGGSTTFQNIELTDFTVDEQWIGGQHHTILGTDQNGATGAGLNLTVQFLTFRRLRIINALTDANTATNHRRGIFFYLSGTGSHNEILCEDCEFQGGNAGFEFIGSVNTVTHQKIRHVRCVHRMRAPLGSGTCSAGATITGTPQTITLSSTTGFVATGGVAMAQPQLYSLGALAPFQITYTSVSGLTLLNCTGSGTLPAGGVVAQWGAGASFGPQTLWFPSSNFQVGGSGLTLHATWEECEGFYSGDVGCEVDNKDYALHDRCWFEDAFKTNNYYTNFSTPAHPDNQVMIYRDHVSRRVLVANAFAGGCFQCDTHSSIPVGRLAFEGDCRAENISGNVGGADCLNLSGQWQAIDLDGLKCVIENFTWSARHDWTHGGAARAESDRASHSAYQPWPLPRQGQWCLHGRHIFIRWFAADPERCEHFRGGANI